MLSFSPKRGRCNTPLDRGSKRIKRAVSVAGIGKTSARLLRHATAMEEQAILGFKTNDKQGFCSDEYPSARVYPIEQGYAYMRPSSANELKRQHRILAYSPKYGLQCKPLTYFYMPAKRKWGVSTTKGLISQIQSSPNTNTNGPYHELTQPHVPVKLYVNCEFDIKRHEKPNGAVLDWIKGVQDLVLNTMNGPSLGFNLSQEASTPLISKAVTETNLCTTTISLRMVFPGIRFRNAMDLYRLCGPDGHMEKMYRSSANVPHELPWETSCYGDWADSQSLEHGSRLLTVSGQDRLFVPVTGDLSPIPEPTEQDIALRLVTNCHEEDGSAEPVEIPLYVDPESGFVPPKSLYLSETCMVKLDEFNINLIKGICRQIHTLRVNMHNKLPEILADESKRRNTTSLDLSLLSVERYGTTPGVYKVVMPGEYYCEIKQCFHSKPVYFIFDTTDFTYYQSDDECKAHELQGERPIVRCANDFDPLCKGHQQCNHKKPKSMLDLYKSGTMFRKKSAMIRLFANANHSMFKLGSMVGGKGRGVCYNEEEEIWNGEIETFCLQELPDFVEQLENMLCLANKSFTPSPKEQAAREQAYEQIPVNRILLGARARNADEQGIKYMNKLAPHIIPMGDKFMFDAVKGKLVVPDKKYFFSKRLNGRLLKRDDPAVKAIEKDFKDVLIDALSEDQEEQWTFWKKVIGYAVSGYTSDRHFYNFFGYGSNGKSFLIAVLSAAMGDFHTGLRASFITESASANESAEGPSPTLKLLTGARAVTIDETTEKPVNRSMIKGITSGNPQNCRGLHQDPTSELTNAKIFAFGNEPLCIGTQQAMLDRYFGVELVNKFIEDPDPTKPRQKQRIPDKCDNITQSMIDGFCTMACYGLTDLLKGSADGPSLKPYPEYVQTCTAKVIKEQNAVREFIRTDADTDAADDDYLPMSDLYAAFIHRCTETQMEEKNMTYKRFRRAVMDMGIRSFVPFPETQDEARGVSFQRYRGDCLPQAKLKDQFSKVYSLHYRPWRSFGGNTVDDNDQKGN